MLDECVSELNCRRKIQRQAERNSTAQSHGGIGRFSSATKRIPSWNNMARESSWGSLEEEGIEAALQLGGPWGGPSLRKLRPVRVNHDGSDSDDNMDQLSWTRVGGPLMRTASAAKFIMCYDGEGDGGTAATQLELRGHESGEETDVAKLPGKLQRGGSGELRSGKRANKIWDKLGVGSFEGKNDELGSSSLDDRDFSFPLQQPSMQKSVNAFLDRLSVTEGETQERQKSGFRIGVSNAACECSGLERAPCDDSNLEQGSDCKQSCTIHDLHSQSLDGAKLVDSNEEPSVGLSGVDEEAATETSMREALKSTSPQVQAEGLQGRALVKGAFGSFVTK
jgi:hypothetical protein